MGSVVLIREDKAPRLKWPSGVVRQVYPGKDDVVCTVDVQTVKGIFTRHIQRLHDLEISGKPQIATFADNQNSGKPIRNSDKTCDSDGIQSGEITNSSSDDNRRSRYGRVLKPARRCSFD